MRQDNFNRNIETESLTDEIRAVICEHTMVEYSDIFVCDGMVGEGQISLAELRRRLNKLENSAVAEAFGHLNNTINELEEGPPKKKRESKKKPKELIDRVVQLGLDENVEPKMIPAIITQEFPGHTVSYSRVTQYIAAARMEREKARQEELHLLNSGSENPQE